MAPSSGPAPFRDCREAGRVLAERLRPFRGAPALLVVALPTGGVLVADEVAGALGAPLEVLVVRKLGLPGYEDLAMGAVGPGGVRVLNHAVIDQARVPREVVDAVAERKDAARRERVRALRGERPPLDVRDRTVIVVDDGLATGSSMRAALSVLRAQRPLRLVAAAPAGAELACEELREDADDVVCVIARERFDDVGQAYEQRGVPSDEEVRAMIDGRSV